MKASDLPEDEQRRQYEDVRRSLDRADRVLDETAHREIPTRLWEAPPAAPPPPAPESAVRRRKPAMTPPMPDKVQVTEHDSAGRVTAIKTYEGASVSQAVSWERWVRAEIKAAVDKGIISFAEALGTELAGEEAQMRAWVDERIAAALGERKRAETRAAGGPRPVGDASDAAD